MAHELLIEPPHADEPALLEWLALPEDEPGELVDGRLVEEEMPDYVHEVLVAWLLGVLGHWVFPRGGVAAGSDAKLVLGSGRGRKPDLTVYLPGREMPPRRGPVRLPPDIAVEVVSPTPRDGRRDRVEKMADYAAFGIRFYWIVDPQLGTLEIFELGEDGRYAQALGATGGVIESVPGCEGLTLDLDRLWSAAEPLAPVEEGKET